MAKKRKTRPHFVALHTAEDSQGRLQVMLPQRVRQDKRLMRWLHHRLVDLLAEDGALSCLDDDVNEQLSLLTVFITSNYIENLLAEGRVAVARQQEREEEDEEAGDARGRQEAPPAERYPRALQTL